MLNTCKTCAHAIANGADWDLALPAGKLLCTVNPPQVFIIPVMQRNPLDPNDIRQSLAAQSAIPTVPVNHRCSKYEHNGIEQKTN